MPFQIADDSPGLRKRDFEKARVINNVRVCSELSPVLLIMNAVLIAVDLTVYRALWSSHPAYVRLFFSHVIVSLLILLWLALANSLKSDGRMLTARGFYYAYTLIILAWGVFLGINDIFMSGQISAFIICVFGISAIPFLSPAEAAVIYLASIAAFDAGLVIFVGNRVVLASHLVNTAITGVIAFIISEMRYKSYLCDYVGRSALTESKTETEKAYKRLKESNLRLRKEIKERRIAEERIRHLVYYDSLTGVYNRKKIMEELNALVCDGEAKFAVLFIDLDKFKQINDKYGHEIGDKVLKASALRLKRAVGQEDMVSRIGGDEFIVILGILKDSGYAEKTAAAIVQELGESVTIGERRISVGASLGMSFFPADGKDADTLVNKADTAMYEVKKRGGCGYLIYSNSMKESTA